MRKITSIFLSAIVLLVLSACSGGGFNADTAFEDSREVAEGFLTAKPTEEVLFTTENYTEDNMNDLYNNELGDYFTTEFKEQHLPNILNMFTFDLNEDGSEIQGNLFTLAKDFGETTIYWNEMSITDQELREDSETVLYRIDSELSTHKSGALEMKIEDGKWKINNLLTSSQVTGF